MSGQYVVVGSGAGGLSTAVAAAHHGARVLVVEKASTCGGATAWSGGWIWAPRHRSRDAPASWRASTDPRRTSSIASASTSISRGSTPTYRARRRWSTSSKSTPHCSSCRAQRSPTFTDTLLELRSGYLKRGRTLRELAEACGIDPDRLEATVAEFNDHARLGEDPAFGRGRTPFNKGSGDPDNPWPSLSLAPLETAPYYAVKVVPGSFGTFAGLATDIGSRVLRSDGSPIPGLYAVGVDQRSVLGGHYPSGGINIGPAMTFGYLSGVALGGVAAPDRGATTQVAR